MNYKTALAKLDQLINYERVAGYDYDLDAYRRFLKQFGSPHLRVKNVILVAGTKGKGSTCAMIESALRSCGFRTGLYSSPHLVNINERVKINNRNISNRDFARLASRVLSKIKKTKGARSFFEALTTIAYLYFLEEKVDFTILEVGLGGRLDATNVTEPLVSVITTIGYDHTNLLGRTLGKITLEKAGIIHPGTPVVLSDQKPAVARLLKKICRERKAAVTMACAGSKLKILKQDLSGSKLRIGDKTCQISFAGEHQIGNLKTALAVLRLLTEQGFRLDKEKMANGLKHTRIKGRIEVYSWKPLIILDAAHNPDSFNALLSVMKKVKTRRLFVVFGISKDKDGRLAYKKIFPKASEIILTRANFPRAEEPRAVLEKIERKLYRRIRLIASVEKAIKYARTRIGQDDCLLIFGSFYVVGDALRILPKYIKRY